MKIYFIGELPPERIATMKVMTQDKARIIDFRMPCTEGYFIRERRMYIAEYKSCERATEVLEEMLQKYAAGEKIYIMPEE